MDGLLTRVVTALAAALWVLAFTLMIVSTFGDRVLCGHWALFVTILAALSTCWCFIRAERHRVDTIVRLTTATLEEHERLPRLVDH